MRAIEKDSSISDDFKRSIFLYADSLLGLDLSRPVERRELTPEQTELLQLRAQARQVKNWGESDRLRDLLSNAGIEINDGPDGQSWS